MRLFLVSFVVIIFTSVSYAGTNIWTGSVDSRWENPLNWSEGAVPRLSDKAVINGRLGEGIIIESNVVVSSLIVSDCILACNDGINIHVDELALINSHINIQGKSELMISEAFQSDKASTITGADACLVWNTGLHKITIHANVEFPAMRSIGANALVFVGDTLQSNGFAQFETPLFLKCHSVFKKGVQAKTIYSSPEFLHTVYDEMAITNSDGVVVDIVGDNDFVVNTSSVDGIVCKNTSKVLLAGDIETRDITITDSVSVFNCGVHTVYSKNKGDFYLGKTSLLLQSDFPKDFSKYDLHRYSTVMYKPLKAQTTEINSSVIYGNLLLDADDTVTVNNDLAVNGNLKLLSGCFNAQSIDTLKVGKNLEVLNTSSLINPPRNIVFNGASSSIQEIVIDADARYAFYNIIINTASEVKQMAPVMHVEGSLIAQKGVFTAYKQTIYIGGDLIANKGRFRKSGHYILHNASDTIFVKTGKQSKLMNLSIDKPNSVVVLQDDLLVQQDFKLNAGKVVSDGNFLCFSTTDNKVCHIGGELLVNKQSVLEIGNDIELYVSPSGRLELDGVHKKPVHIRCNEKSRFFSIKVDGEVSASHYIINNLSEKGLFISKQAHIDTCKNLSSGVFRHCADSGNLLTINADVSLKGASAIKYITFEGRYRDGFTVSRSADANGIIEFFYARGRTAGDYFTHSPANNVIWTGSNQLIWKQDAASVDWEDEFNWFSVSGASQIPNDTCIVYVEEGAVNMPELKIDASCLGFVTDPLSSLTLQSNSSILVKDSVLLAGDINIESNSDFTLHCENHLLVSKSAKVKNKGEFTIAFNSSRDSVVVDFAGLTLDNISFENSALYSLQNIDKLNGSFKNTSIINNSGMSRFTVGGDWVNKGLFTEPVFDLELSPHSSIIVSDNSRQLNHLLIEADNEVTISDSLFIQGDFTTLGKGTLLCIAPVILSGDLEQGLPMASSSIRYNGDVIQHVKGLLQFDTVICDNPEGLNLLNDLYIDGELSLVNGKIYSDTNTVRLGKNATVEKTVNAGSWVVAKFEKSGTADFVFPIGSISVYAPLKIGNMADTSQNSFVAFYKDGAPLDTITKEKTISHFYNSGYWDLDRVSGTVAPVVGVKLPDSYNYSQDIIAHYHIDQWYNMGGCVDNEGFVVSEIPFNQFSPIAVAKNNEALPVELLYFGLNQDINNDIEFYWETASEVDLSHFIIEYRDENEEFISLGEVSAKASSSYGEMYSYNTINDFKDETLYFRLKMVDMDGSVKYSDLISADSNGLQANEMYPNPVKYGLEFFLKTEDAEFISIKNVSGATVFESLCSGKGKIKLSADFPKGLYYVSFIKGETTDISMLMID